MGNESRFLPLSFYDGKSEINIGQVRIHSSLDYKTFQSILSEKIGISPNQMSIYFVDNDKNNNPNQRRILITGKASFNLILQGKDCTVLVVLKRSRKDRRQRSKLNSSNVVNYFHLNNNDLPPPPPPPQPDNINLLVPDYYAFPVSPFYNQIGVHEFLDYNDRFRNLYNICPARIIMEEPRFVSDQRCNYYYYYYYGYCEECMNARRLGKVVQFHLCVNDAVTVSFRSSAGPIARPGGC